MKLREMAVAVAALSLAGAAMAAGNDTSSTTTNRVPSARQGQSLDQSTASQQGQSSDHSATSSQGNPTSKMSGANGGSQGSMANEEHNPQMVREAQQALKHKGFDVGAVDGQMGPNTENALRQFQQSQGIQQSGNLDQQTLSALGVNENGSSSGNTSSQGTGSQGASQGSSSSQSQGAMGTGSTGMGSSQGSQGAGSQQGSRTSSTQGSAYK